MTFPSMSDVERSNDFNTFLSLARGLPKLTGSPTRRPPGILGSEPVSDAESDRRSVEKLLELKRLALDDIDETTSSSSLAVLRELNGCD